MRLTAVGSLAALVLAVGATPVGAQRIAGTLRDAGSGIPISGAVVSELDSLGASLARVISDDAGRFSLEFSARAARLRIVRIGYQPQSIPVSTSSATSPVDVRMTKLATLLSTLLVNERRVCPGEEERTGALSLWEQARAALLASVVARETQPAMAMIMTYERVTDSLHHLLRQTAAIATGGTTRAFIAGDAPATLADRGYMLAGPEGRRFAAPDADVLLHDTFAATHCFSVAAADSVHPASIGLAFQPAPGRAKVIDVRGILWLSAGTPALESIEYRYTGGEAVWERMGASGVIHFTTMPNGVVFVDRWKVLLPVLVGPDLARVSTGPTFRWIGGSLIFRSSTADQVSETGGVVLSQTWPNELHYDAWLEPLNGEVVEQGTQMPVMGARVTISATGDTLDTDDSGHFSLHPVLPGNYTIAVADTTLTAFLAPRIVTRSVELGDGKRPAVRFEIPNRVAAARALCEGTPVPAGTSVVLGRLADARGTPLPTQLRVTGAWLRSEGAAEMETETVSVDAQGRFSLCGVPRNRLATLAIAREATELADTTFALGTDTPLGILQWNSDVAALASARPRRAAALRGRVVRDGGEAPVAGADVWLPTHDRHATTDASGNYRFDDLRPGPALIQVRGIGFASHRDTLTLGAGDDAIRNVSLDSRASMLDTVRTTATSLQRYSSGLKGFERRRARGEAGGYFLSDSLLRRNDGRSVANVIVSHANGLALQPGKNGGLQLISSRKACTGPIFTICQSPNCYVTVFLDGALYYQASMGTPPPDMTRMDVSEFTGIEFYPSSGAGPVEYNATGNGCGTLLLWSRER